VQSPCAHHVSPQAKQIINLTLLRCQRLSQGAGARRRLFARPAWPRRALLWHDHRRASRKPVPSFPPSLRHHVSPGAGQIVNIMLSRCQRMSQGAGARRRLFEWLNRGSVRSHGRRGRGVRYSDTTIKAHHVSPPHSSRRAFV
jgi:hypothetical protein